VLLSLMRTVASAVLEWPLAVSAAAEHWTVTESKHAITDEIRRTAAVTLTHPCRRLRDFNQSAR
jgi:hypothetical protein